MGHGTKLKVFKMKMAEKHFKRCSTFLTINEIQIKTTLRFYVIPFGITNIKNQMIIKYWCVCKDRGKLIRCWFNLPHDPAIPLLDIYLKDPISYYRYLPIHVHCYCAVSCMFPVIDSTRAVRE